MPVATQKQEGDKHDGDATDEAIFDEDEDGDSLGAETTQAEATATTKATMAASGKGENGGRGGDDSWEISSEGK